MVNMETSHLLNIGTSASSLWECQHAMLALSLKDLSTALHFFKWLWSHWSSLTTNHVCTVSAHQHWTHKSKCGQKGSEADLNHVLINLFILSGHVSPLSQSLTQRSHCEMSNLFWPENRKERKTNMWSWKQTHIQRPARCDAGAPWSLAPLLEPCLICQLPIGSP